MLFNIMKGIILLKNEDNILPLNRNEKIIVVGQSTLLCNNTAEGLIIVVTNHDTEVEPDVDVDGEPDDLPEDVADPEVTEGEEDDEEPTDGDNGGGLELGEDGGLNDGDAGF